MNKFFNRHDLPKNTLLNSVPGQQNKIYLGKMATKVEMYSATHESVILPVDRDRKIRTALRTNQIVGFVTVPSEKKINPFILLSGERHCQSKVSFPKTQQNNPVRN